jgi:hypothetical protein
VHSWQYEIYSIGCMSDVCPYFRALSCLRVMVNVTFTVTHGHHAVRSGAKNAGSRSPALPCFPMSGILARTCRAGPPLSPLCNDSCQTCARVVVQPPFPPPCGGTAVPMELPCCPPTASRAQLMFWGADLLYAVAVLNPWGALTRQQASLLHRPSES